MNANCTSWQWIVSTGHYIIEPHQWGKFMFLFNCLLIIYSVKRFSHKANIYDLLASGAPYGQPPGAAAPYGQPPGAAAPYGQPPGAAAPYGQPPASYGIQAGYPQQPQPQPQPQPHSYQQPGNAGKALHISLLLTACKHKCTLINLFSCSVLYRFNFFENNWIMFIWEDLMHVINWRCLHM